MHLLIHIVGSCALWMVCSSFDPGFAMAFGHILRRNDNSFEESKTILGGPQDDITQFFYPRTCQPREGQNIKACHGNKNLNQTMCLKFSCCYSLEENNKITCYAPFVDDIQLTLRFFIIGIVCLISLGCIPICCCIICQKSKLTNKLRGNLEVTKILLNHSDTLENIDEMAETLIQEDEKRKAKKKKKNRKGNA